MTQPKTASRVAVIGGGPAGLIAAEVLAGLGHKVTLYEKMPTVGRKFLIAGRGGLNLTHSEPIDKFIKRYSESGWLTDALHSFSPLDLRQWCHGLGEETFVGSSGRVFPSSFRATKLLRAWLQRLSSLEVDIHTSVNWLGWTATGALRLENASGEEFLDLPQAVLIALGGASWPRTGSDGSWVTPLSKAGIKVVSLKPSNCGFVVQWSPAFAKSFAGTPLKNVELSFDGVNVRGEAMITDSGIEGGAVYELSAALRDSLLSGAQTDLTIDLRPDLSHDRIGERLAKARSKDSVSNQLRRAAGITAVGVGLMREATVNDLPHDSKEIAALAKCVSVRLEAPRPLDRAISTAGGITRSEIDERFMLKSLPGTFIAGEMLDWEAPTGGYLLQGAFSTGVAAAHGIDEWLTLGLDA